MNDVKKPPKLLADPTIPISNSDNGPLCSGVVVVLSTSRAGDIHPNELPYASWKWKTKLFLGTNWDWPLNPSAF